MDVQRYLRRIRKALPDLHFQHARLPQQGMDHCTIILDNTWVFRFPHTKKYRSQLPQEFRLLAALHNTLPLPIPYYECIANDESFGGYRVIPGVQVSRRTFRLVSPVARRTIARSLGRFLSVLHAFPVRRANRLGVETITLVGELSEVHQQYRRFLAKRLTAEERAYCEEIFRQSEEIARTHTKLVFTHNDFSWAHILLHRDGKGVAGIIDFSDRAIADPAYDFSYFWDVDPHLASEIYAHYRPKDAALLHRAMLRRKRGSISWLAYHAKKGTRESYQRAYRQFRKVMRWEV